MDAVEDLLRDVRQRIEWFEHLRMTRVLSADEQAVYRSLLVQEEELLKSRVPSMG